MTDISNNNNRIGSKWIDDAISMVNSKTIFFAPIFGGFVSMLAAKSDVVKSLGGVGAGVFALAFFLGMSYALYLTSYLQHLEVVRFSVNVRNELNDEDRINYDQKIDKDLAYLMAAVPKRSSTERRRFSSTMYYLYWSISL